MRNGWLLKALASGLGAYQPLRPSGLGLFAVPPADSPPAHCSTMWQESGMERWLLRVTGLCLQVEHYISWHDAHSCHLLHRINSNRLGTGVTCPPSTHTLWGLSSIMPRRTCTSVMAICSNDMPLRYQRLDACTAGCLWALQTPVACSYEMGINLQACWRIKVQYR